MVWRILEIAGVMFVAKGLGKIEPFMNTNQRVAVAYCFVLGVAFVVTSVLIRSE